MRSRIGQSSIEYLTTYGWMALAATLAGATLYPTLSTGCDVSLESENIGSSLKIEQIGVDNTGNFKIRIDSESEQRIDISSLNITKDEESQEVAQSNSIPPGSEITYTVGNVERTGSCQEYQIEIQYSKGPLEDQSEVISVKGSLNLIETLSKLLKSFGDSITSIKVTASVQPTNDTICIGSNCNGESWKTEDEHLRKSGDKMTGPLNVGEIQAKCYGEKCQTEIAGTSGFVSLGEGLVNGTLNVTTIKPLGGTTTFR